MEKRKQRALLDPSTPPLSSPRHPPFPTPPSDSIPCYSGMNLLSSKKSADDINTNLKKRPRSSAKDSFMIESAIKQSNAPLSLSHHHHHNHQHQNSGRSFFLKRSRYQGYHHHYPRHHGLTSHGCNTTMYLGHKRTPFLDQKRKLSFKVGDRWNAEFEKNSDGLENGIYLPERIRASPSSSMEIISSAGLNMVCGLCYRHIRSSSISLSMVAVLVCGHVFHANCIERGTRIEDERDPPCPLCSGLSHDARDA